jgi:hypothetical protein
MNSRRIQIFIAMFFLMSVTLACGFSVSTANIKDAYMARDEAGTDRTTVFTSEDTFYCIVDLANAPDDTTVKAVWYAVDAQDVDPNFKIDEYSLTSGDNVIPFSLSNDMLWPSGTYKVELYLNDELDRTLEFSVQ